MIVKLLPEHHLKFLSLKGCGRGSFESTHVIMPHCWKSHALSHMVEGTVYHKTVFLVLHTIYDVSNVCIFQSLLHVLRESHRTRTVFRKVGGFVYVMSVLVSMEGCLADPPKPPWDKGKLYSLNMETLKYNLHVDSLD